MSSPVPNEQQLPLHLSAMGSLISAFSPTTAHTPATRKRSASSAFDPEETTSSSRKRSREDSDPEENMVNASGSGVAGERGDTLAADPDTAAKSGVTIARKINGEAFADALALSLQCGCCTELCYNPVMVSPCQHFFCGSCCALWVQNGGTNCPACRGVATSQVAPSRMIQELIDLLLRFAPSKGRLDIDKAQADEIYKAGTLIKLPVPRPKSPEPTFGMVQGGATFARPCPHCVPGNPFGWRCPHPIADPNTDRENAFNLDNGTPQGHAFCGYCDQLHPPAAPASTKCDFCQVSFCGVGVEARCVALPLASQRPNNFETIADMIESGEVYDIFQGNNVEVDILFDYLCAQDITPRQIYREVVEYFQSMPDGFTSLIEDGIFEDVHNVPGGVDPNPLAPRQRICRGCAVEVFLAGLRDWWSKERNKGLLPDDIKARPDCVELANCNRQSELGHSREFNHIPPPLAIPQMENIAPPEERSLAINATNPVPAQGDSDPSESASSNSTQSSHNLPDQFSLTSGRPTISPFMAPLPPLLEAGFDERIINETAQTINTDGPDTNLMHSFVAELGLVDPSTNLSKDDFPHILRSDALHSTSHVSSTSPLVPTRSSHIA